MLRKLLNLLRWPAAALGALLLYLGVLPLFHNFHAVVEGEVYRAAQPSAVDILHYASHQNIRSILNLRGENVGKTWYDDELAEAKKDGIQLINFRMSMKRELSREEAENLIRIMREAPKPLLIHCRAGADRTGLAAALYVAAIAKQGEWAAERQLWINYGHVPLWFTDAFAMNRSFEKLEAYLGFWDS